MNDGDRRNVHGVARVCFKGANAALAENDFVVAAGEQVFRGAQQFFDRGRNPAFEQHRLADLAQFAQKIEVLHVARAHLKDVDIRQHQRNLGDLHDLADHEQFEMIARFAQQLQAVNAQPLKRIRRGSRFESAATENARSGFVDQVGDGEQLLAGFDGAGPRHDDDFLAADFNSIRKFDDRAFGTEVSSGQLVGGSDAVNSLHPWQHFDHASVEITRNSDSAKDRLMRTGGTVNLKAELNQSIDHLLDLIFTGRIFHCDDHECARFAWPETQTNEESPLAAFRGSLSL